MGLFDWLAGLFGGTPDETPGDVADRIERIADRFANAGDDHAAAAARTAADDARRAPTADVARDIEAAFLQTRGLRPDGRPIKPAVGRAGDADYVRYGSTIRTGGSRAWRYNNPGYVRCTSRSTSYGAIGCDGEFAIFPNYHTGMYALHRTLRDEYPGQAVGDALRQHLPPEAGVDPDRIFSDAGLDPATPVEDVPVEDFGGMGSALQSQPGFEAGEQFSRDSADAPAWVESAWDAPAGDGGGAEAESNELAAPTDNS